MKKNRFLVAIAAAMVLAVGMFGLTACGSNNGGSNGGSSDAGAYADLEPVKMVFGANIPVGGISDEWVHAVAENLEAETDGQFTLDVFAYGDLGGNADIMRQTQSNDVQLYYTEPATLTSFIPELAVFDCPMIFQGYTPEQIESTLNGDNEFTQELNKGFEKAGVKNLMWLQNGTFRQVTSNKELRTLADYKGFQIRTMENAYHMAFWSAVGAEPTPLTFAEVYFALQNGTVDGQENALFTSVGNSFQEVQKYVCFTNHILYSGQIVMNTDAWNSLDPLYQEALMKAISTAHDSVRELIAESDKADLQTMIDGGMEVIEYDDQFFADYVGSEGVQKVYSDISEATNGLPELLKKTLDAA